MTMNLTPEFDEVEDSDSRVGDGDSEDETRRTIDAFVASRVRAGGGEQSEQPGPSPSEAGAGGAGGGPTLEKLERRLHTAYARFFQEWGGGGPPSEDDGGYGGDPPPPDTSAYFPWHAEAAAHAMDVPAPPRSPPQRRYFAVRRGRDLATSPPTPLRSAIFLRWDDARDFVQRSEGPAAEYASFASIDEAEEYLRRGYRWEEGGEGAGSPPAPAGKFRSGQGDADGADLELTKGASGSGNRDSPLGVDPGIVAPPPLCPRRKQQLMRGDGTSERGDAGGMSPKFAEGTGDADVVLPDYPCPVPEPRGYHERKRPAAETESKGGASQSKKKTPAPRTCRGITYHHFARMRLKPHRRAELQTAFFHTISVGLNTRERLFHPGDDRWKFSPPVVGAIEDGNKAGEVKWLVKEFDHLDSDKSIEHMGISAVECRGEELEGVKVLCRHCSSRNKSLQRVIQANTEDKRAKFNPNTRESVSGLTTSLQAKRTDYYRNLSRDLRKKLARQNRVIDKLTKKTEIEMKDGIFDI